MYQFMRRLISVSGLILLLILPAVADTYNFVLMTDENYVIPTAVAVQSLKESRCEVDYNVIIFTKGICKSSQQALLQMQDEYVRIYLIDLLAEEWKTMPCIDGCQINLMERANEIQSKDWSELVNLRLLFPDIWASKLLPTDIRNIDTFVWLDSDLIVKKDLSYLFVSCRATGQFIVGANLFFLEFGGVGYVPSNCIKSALFKQVGDGYARISGGVVFYNIREIVKCFKEKGQNEWMVLFEELKSQRGENPEEEVVFDEFLRQQDLVYFFEPQYNACPDSQIRTRYLWYWSEHLRDENLKCNSFIFVIKNGNPVAYSGTDWTIECMNELIDGNVNIWHWDCCRKPWYYKYIGLRANNTPEVLWYRLFQATTFKDRPLALLRQGDEDI